MSLAFPKHEHEQAHARVTLKNESRVEVAAAAAQSDLLSQAADRQC
jgi:hypothetical protein